MTTNPYAAMDLPPPPSSAAAASMPPPPPSSIDSFDAEYRSLRSHLVSLTAENLALNRALHERSLTIAAIRSSKDEAEIGAISLQVQLECLQQDLDAHKQHIRLLKKDLRLRNEEKQQRKIESDAANRRIAILETECHRLRRLLFRQKPPRSHFILPASFDSSSYGAHGSMNDSAMKKKKKEMASMDPHHSPDYRDHLHKHTQALTEKLASAEEENQLLKETLFQRTVELETATKKLRYGADRDSYGGHRPLLHEACCCCCHSIASAAGDEPLSINTAEEECFLQQRSVAITEMSSGSDQGSVISDGDDVDGGRGGDGSTSAAESWAMALMSELSQLRNGNYNEEEEEEEKHGYGGDGDMEININPGLIMVDDLIQLQMQQQQQQLGESPGSNAAAASSHDPHRLFHSQMNMGNDVDTICCSTRISSIGADAAPAAADGYGGEENIEEVHSKEEEESSKLGTEEIINNHA